MPDKTKETPQQMLRRELGSPYRLFGFARLVAGGLCLLVGIYAFSALSAAGSIPALLREASMLMAEEEGRCGFLLRVALLAATGSCGMLAGLLCVLAGIKHILRFHPPGRIPGDYANFKQLLRSFLQMEVLTYRAPTGWPLAIMRLLFSENVAFLPPSARQLCVVNIAYLPFALLPIAFIMLLTSTGGVTEAVAGFSLTKVPSPRLWLAVVLAAGVFRIIASLFLVPSQAPASAFHRSHHTLTGSSHPESYLNEIEHVADGFRHLAMPNRIHQRRPIELKPSADPATGKIRGSIFFETQPAPVCRNKKTAGQMLLAGGVVFLPLGLLLIALLPYDNQVVPISHFASNMLPKRALWLIAGLELFRNGILCFGQAKTVLGTLTYASDIFLIEFNGTYFKGEISAGMATTDSLRTTSTALRSEVVIRYHAASCISESVNFAERELVEATDSPAIRSRLDTLMHSLEHFQDQGAQLMSIDLEGSPAISRLAGANISLQATREAAVHQARSTGALPANLPISPGLLPETKKTAPPFAEDAKECPECAEIIRVKARKCRFCGHRLDEDDAVV